MPNSRRHFTCSQKIAILRLHLLEHMPISDVCQENDLQPTAFYLWQKKLFENGAAVLERPQAANSRHGDAIELGRLKAMLRQRNDALAELVTDYLIVRRSAG
jgi:transposase